MQSIPMHSRANPVPLLLALVGALILPLVGPELAAAAEPNSRLIEQFQFELRDLVISHQGGNTLQIIVQYDYRSGIKASEYPDFRGLAKECEDFFRNYPNSTDFWEVLNRKLTAQVLQRHAELAAVRCEIRVAPTEREAHHRASIVTRRR